MLGLEEMIHTSIGKIRFGVHGYPKTKLIRALLGPKADNILSGLSWVMTYDIRAAPRVLLNDGGANFSEDAESLRRLYVTS